MQAHTFDRISLFSLLFFIVFLPLFFLPFTNVPVEMSKGLFFVVGLSLTVVFWALARFFDGNISIPKSPVLFAGKGVVLATLISTLFNTGSQVSFFGMMFDLGSFWFIFCAFLLMFMSAMIFRSFKNARVVLFGIVLSGALVVVFQILHLFLPKVLSLGVLFDKTSNVFGSWNALGIFAGLIVLTAVLIIEFFQTTNVEKLILKLLIAFSVFLVMAVNFSFIWLILGISSFLIFIYKFLNDSKKHLISIPFIENGRDSFPALPFIIMVISILFIVSGSFLSGIVPNRLGVSNTEVSPSIMSTFSVTRSILKESPMFGLGPNKFADAWAMYKPMSLNSTQFWDVSFGYGSGLLPTYLATTGYVGILAWVVFFGLFLFSGLKSVFLNIKKGESFETATFFILSLYLFLACFFYAGGIAIFLLALIFAGIFIGLSFPSKEKGDMYLPFLSDHRKSLITMLFVLVIVIVSVVLSFKYIERFTSVFYFRKAIASNTILDAENNIDKALTLYTNDLYLRTYAQIYLVKLNTLVNKGVSTLSLEDKADLQPSLDKAVKGAELAIGFDSKNYLNFRLLGSVYQTAGSFGAKDAYVKSIEAYKMASKLNPNNPGIKLDLASTSFAIGNVKDAKEYANTALSLKPDYIDALIFLSQVAKSEGDTAGSISYAEKALLVNPGDQNLIKYLETLKKAPTPAQVPSSSSGKTQATPIKKKP